ncbi:MAG: N-acetyltransferase family protein [Alphaproteobacteria bacterium]
MVEARAILLRDAVKADLPAIVALLADDPIAAGRETPADPLPDSYAAAFDAMTAQPGNVVILAEIEGRIAGCLQLTFIPGLTRTGSLRAQVEGVRVAGGWRGHGIGETLMQEAIRRSREAGCGLIQLTTDQGRTDARRFYERLGFTASHFGMKLALDG